MSIEKFLVWGTVILFGLWLIVMVCEVLGCFKNRKVETQWAEREAERERQLIRASRIAHQEQTRAMRERYLVAVDEIYATGGWRPFPHTHDWLREGF